ncbi:MAG: hypothetical protein HC894_25280 [Microcoleus sp. SM1_3_4]|nr:hypothetical protein [Microcoleus sp. SM1_3_4]
MNYNDWTVTNAVSLQSPAAMVPAKPTKARSLTRETLLRAAAQVILDRGVER